MEEVHTICPHCWQRISMLVDTSVPEQRYVEDCEVCCRPLDVHVVVDDAEVIVFEAEPIGQ